MNKSFINLRKQSKNKSSVWTLENLRDGFEYYYSIHGKYPTAWEVDSFLYLPSSRQIQRAYGGLMKLRKTLNLKTPLNHSSGKTRSITAQESDKRARIYEQEFYELLVGNYSEMAVHEHKVMRPGNISSDYYVYTTPHSGIVIDLFYAKNLLSLAGILNIKVKKYSKLNQRSILICVGNHNISQKDVDTLLRNKKNIWPANITVCTELYFINNMNNLIKKTKYNSD